MFPSTKIVPTASSSLQNKYASQTKNSVGNKGESDSPQGKIGFLKGNDSGESIEKDKDRNTNNSKHKIGEEVPTYIDERNTKPAFFALPIELKLHVVQYFDNYQDIARLAHVSKKGAKLAAVLRTDETFLKENPHLTDGGLKFRQAQKAADKKTLTRLFVLLRPDLNNCKEIVEKLNGILNKSEKNRHLDEVFELLTLADIEKPLNLTQEKEELLKKDIVIIKCLLGFLKPQFISQTNIYKMPLMFQMKWWVAKYFGSNHYFHFIQGTILLALLTHQKSEFNSEESFFGQWDLQSPSWMNPYGNPIRAAIDKLIEEGDFEKAQYLLFHNGTSLAILKSAQTVGGDDDDSDEAWTLSANVYSFAKVIEACSKTAQKQFNKSKNSNAHVVLEKWLQCEIDFKSSAIYTKHTIYKTPDDLLKNVAFIGKENNIFPANFSYAEGRQLIPIFYNIPIYQIAFLLKLTDKKIPDTKFIEAGIDRQKALFEALKIQIPANLHDVYLPILFEAALENNNNLVLEVLMDKYCPIKNKELEDKINAKLAGI